MGILNRFRRAQLAPEIVDQVMEMVNEIYWHGRDCGMYAGDYPTKNNEPAETAEQAANDKIARLRALLETGQ